MAGTNSNSDTANMYSAQLKAESTVPSAAIIADNLETSVHPDVKNLVSSVAISDSKCSKDISESDKLPVVEKSLPPPPGIESTLHSCSTEKAKLGHPGLKQDISSGIQLPQKKISLLVDLEDVSHPDDTFFVAPETVEAIAMPGVLAYESKNNLTSKNSDEPMTYDVANEPEMAKSIPFGATLSLTKKNMQQIMCLKCQSTILIPEMATLVDIEYTLPEMFPNVLGYEDIAQKESLKRYWCVENMFSFENVGFSHTKEGIKYLICADCEIGPIGWHNVETKLSYVSPFRIRYV